MNTKIIDMLTPVLIAVLFATNSLGTAVNIHCTNSAESYIETISSGTTYYIDATGGNDSNDGLSEETAWKTIAKVNSMNFNPADLILFKRGENWQEQLTVSSSGSSDNPITYGAYGNGNKPIINCASTISGWIQATPIIYTTSVATEPPQVFFNGIRGTPVALDQIDSEHEWNWTSNMLHIYSTSNPDTAGLEIEVSNKEFAIYIDSMSYITIKDIACKGAGIQDGPSAGIFLVNTNNVILDNLTVYDNAGSGIFIYSDSAGAGKNNIVCNCTVYNTIGTRFSINNGYNLGCGIQLWTPSPGYGGNNKICGNTVYKNGDHGIGLEFSNNMISNNVAYQNGRSGISISAEHSSGNIVERNTVYQNCQNEDDVFGINLFWVGNNNIVRYNIVHDQHVLPVGEGFLYGSGGIRVDGVSSIMTESTGNQIYYNLVYNEYDGVQIYNFRNVGIYNNVIYNSTRAGIYIGSTTTSDNVVKNNVIHTSEKFLVVIDKAVNNVFDHNVYHPDTPTSFNLNNIISDFATWKLNSGQDKDSKAKDPLLVNIANSDFHLQSISPCIDTGVDVGLTQDFEGKSVPYGSAPDVGAYESEQVMFTGTISGRVTARDTGLAIQGATVITDGRSGMTNSTGGFTITDIPTGTHTVTALMAGYQSQSRYNVSVQDNKTTIVNFELQENNFPEKPEKPSGPTEGKCWVPYTYFSSAIDIDNDKIRYGWDWDGDYVVDEWTLLYEPGEEVEVNHSWYVTGYYEIRVKAMDVHGAESNWSDPLPVSMPKNKHSIKLLFSQPVERLLEKFPSLKKQFNPLTSSDSATESNSDRLFISLEVSPMTFGKTNLGALISKTIHKPKY